MAITDSANMLAIAVAFLNLSTILWLLRFVTMRMTRRAFGLDDILLAGSWLFVTALSINMIAAVAYGAWGTVIDDPPLLDDGNYDMSVPGYWMWLNATTMINKFGYASSILYIPQLALAKLSLVLFYRRTLVPEPYGFTHRATQIAIVIITLWGLSFWLTYIFQCGTQFSLVWDPLQTDAAELHCVPTSLELVNRSTDVILDVMVAILPLRRIHTLHLSASKKTQVTCAFLVGSLSLVGAVIRLATYISINVQASNALTDDPENYTNAFQYWAMFECGFAFATASLPGLRPLINNVASSFNQTFTTIRDKTPRSQNSKSSGLPSPPAKAGYEVHVSSA